jgi:SET domain-containing protein
MSKTRKPKSQNKNTKEMVKRSAKKKPASAKSLPKGQWFALDIKPSKIHGLGLFAGEDIPWGKRVIVYAGERIGEREYQRRERFYDSIGYTRMFSLDDDTTIDALVGGNASCFINHSVKPNLGVLREDDEIYFYSLTNIDKNTELTFDYEFEP